MRLICLSLFLLSFGEVLEAWITKWGITRLSFEAIPAWTRGLMQGHRKGTALGFLPVGVSNTLDELFSNLEKLKSVGESTLAGKSQSIKIKEARTMKEIASIVSLRVATFHPGLKTVNSYHQRVAEKIGRRIGSDGAVVLVATRAQRGDGVARGNSFYGNVVGTVEFCAKDFTNTTMETRGARRKLYVADLAIRGDARRIGLASRLLQTIEDYAIANDFQELYLHVDKGNEPALRLYKTLGFVEVGMADWARHFTETRLDNDADCFHFFMKRIKQSEVAVPVFQDQQQQVVREDSSVSISREL